VREHRDGTGLARTVTAVEAQDWNQGKDPEMVLGEYLAADSPGEWLVDEVGEYLFPQLDEDDREEGLSRVFDRIDDDRKEFLATQREPGQLVLFSLTVEQTKGTVLRASFSEIPVPVVLLDLCLRVADVGDAVCVEHHYATGDSVEFTSTWPFGMDWAVRATTPLGERLVSGELEAHGAFAELSALHGVKATDGGRLDDDDDDDDEFDVVIKHLGQLMPDRRDGGFWVGTATAVGVVSAAVAGIAGVLAGVLAGRARR
jgi:hypothetical protein